ncbi:MAG: hypothetical protein ACQEW8_10150 [Actinomycetota bacterium]
MTSQQAVYRRVLRRETHRGRTVASVVVASILVLVLLVVLAGGIWWAVDPAVRAGSDAAVAGLAAALDGRIVLLVAGIAAVVLALVLVALALLPGRRARRARDAERVALLVDDGILADAVADQIAMRCGLTAAQVSTVVGRRSVTATITPTSGAPLDRDAALAAITDTVSGLGFTATPKVVVADRGVIA